MNGLAIRVEDVGKMYQIGGPQERYKTLRDSLMDGVRKTARSVDRVVRRGHSSQRNAKETIWALKNVSFEVQSGDVVGVIGRNGAGKSTLLKILSRITDPTTGFAEIHGRVGSLLEVGTGFHPELTGRENIYLNGAILGMKRTEIDRKFDEMVDFAEVRRFIETPVKHYSSGMYLRLAFAVAAHLEPEILLIDEVLAVGDAAFQKKCLGKMGEVAEAGRTVLFVSHNMPAVIGLCKRAIWIDNGSIVADGPVEDVAQSYVQTLSKGTFSYSNKVYDLTVRSIALKNSVGEITTRFDPGEDLIVELCYDAKRKIQRPFMWVKVLGREGACFAANMLLDGNRPETLEGEGCIQCKFKSIPLLPQTYSVVVALRSEKKEAIMAPQEVASFTVYADLKNYGFTGEVESNVSKSTPVLVPYEWTLPDGRVARVSLNGPRKAE